VRKLRRVFSVSASVVLSFIVLLSCETLALAGDWPQWRGPDGNGVAPAGSPPLVWSETENVRWKVAVPGAGLASPIVFGDRVYLLSAIPPEAPAKEPAGEEEQDWRRSIAAHGPVEFVVLAYDRATGELVWRQTAIVSEPHEGTHGDATWASASPVTDGEVLIASFGSRGVFAYDLSGELLWSRDLGDMSTRNGFGEGASPALFEERVVINWDHEGESFLVVLDKKTGEEVWRRERDEPTSWSTPIVEVVDGRAQVIVSATGKIRGYDLATGDTVWELGGMTLNVVPTPFEVEGVLYAASGFRGIAVRAVRLAGAAGDLEAVPSVPESESEGEAVVSSPILWAVDEDAPYVPTPVVAGGSFYMIKTNTGILTSLDANTGEKRYGPVRLPGIDGVYASLVAVSERVYVVGRGGTTVVVGVGAEYEVLAENHLDDRFDASAALAGDEVFLRGREFLYCLAEENDSAGDTASARSMSE